MAHNSGPSGPGLKMVQRSWHYFEFLKTFAFSFSPSSINFEIQSLSFLNGPRFDKRKQGLLSGPAVLSSPSLAVTSAALRLRAVKLSGFLRIMAAFRFATIFDCIREVPASNFSWVTSCFIWDLSFLYFLHSRTGAFPQFNRHCSIHLVIRRHTTSDTAGDF